ncbi:unnamed protein product [Urochloa humidicola]
MASVPSGTKSRTITSSTIAGEKRSIEATASSSHRHSTSMGWIKLLMMRRRLAPADAPMPASATTIPDLVKVYQEMEIRRTRKEQVWKIRKTFSSMVNFWAALVRDDMCSGIKDISTLRRCYPGSNRMLT